MHSLFLAFIHPHASSIHSFLASSCILYFQLACIHLPSCINTQVHLDFNQGEQHQSRNHKLSSCTLSLDYSLSQFLVSSWFCSIILIHDTYRLTLPNGVEIHPIFHVSRLKELLGSCNNTITTKTLVTSEDLASNHMYQRKFSMLK